MQQIQIKINKSGINGEAILHICLTNTYDFEYTVKRIKIVSCAPDSKNNVVEHISNDDFELAIMPRESKGHQINIKNFREENCYTAKIDEDDHGYPLHEAHYVYAEDAEQRINDDLGLSFNRFWKCKLP
ncbi:hypothetical protein FW781_17730 [Chryseobacterium panacisoli]|uniref:Uncharacterized protein n=1 Tax=Chryseobacterium panacisoli TaxID=1807141 RepID=A0A5D8ZEX3_9FLAO|nr:hypothetical protein [Chryseobacterium panacisoli]TZF93535.1 hypothetical protein FW781_17730 [Chryseobacterium panacisoli]